MTAIPTEHAESDAAELVAAGRALLDRHGPAGPGVWPWAVAFLARQVIEQCLDELWSDRAPGTEHASARAQLICLPSYLDRDLAGRVAYAWSVLSNVCHHHAYELAPTAKELENWLDIAAEFDDAVRASKDSSG